jgi:hypothetical protein
MFIFSPTLFCDFRMEFSWKFEEEFREFSVWQDEERFFFVEGPITFVSESKTLKW